MKNDTIRLALIGYGVHSSQYHGPALERYAREHPGELELAAVCDLEPVRAQAAAERHGFRKTYTDIDAMLESERLDGCMMVMPVPLIVPEGIAMLRRGMPCVLEKPPGRSPEEAQALADAAEATGTPHMVSVDRRFRPYLLRALAWCRERGPIRLVNACMLRHRRREPEFVWSTGVHAVDSMRHIAGDIARVSCLPAGGPECTSAWYQVQLEFRNGALGQLSLLPTAGALEERYELYGEGFRAIVSYDSRRSRLQLWQDNAAVTDEQVSAGQDDGVRLGTLGEVAEFVAALREGRPPRASVHDVLPSLELCFRLAAEAPQQARA